MLSLFGLQLLSLLLGSLSGYQLSFLHLTFAGLPFVTSRHTQEFHPSPTPPQAALLARPSSSYKRN